MSKTTIFDIFISYRRDGGGVMAGRINDRLTADGFTVSYDVKTLREGRFDLQLLERIEQCQDFVLVVDKNCFVRTLDPKTDPQTDWLWQELAYALRLKKNIIPVFMDGAVFPERMPDDIDNVRLMHGLKCVHEYFDSFYFKLKENLHAYPRKAQLSSNVAHVRHYLKLKADMDCIFYLDGEEQGHLKARVLNKFPLAKGEYELLFVSEDNESDCLEMVFAMPEMDKFQGVNLSGIRDARLKREAEEEEQRSKRTFNVGGVEFKMIRVEGGTSGTFYIGETQVTQALWEAVMGDNPSYFKGYDRPVEKVSWNDCRVFINKLNVRLKEELGGIQFRLPKEAEWEYAARGGNKSRGYASSGCDGESESEQYACYDKNAYYCGSSKQNLGHRDYGTHNVKTSEPNELGLYDMSGDVWEWCEDKYDASYSGRVLRVGGWLNDAQYCRVACRGFYDPRARFSDLGFRLALVQQ